MSLPAWVIAPAFAATRADRAIPGLRRQHRQDEGQAAGDFQVQGVVDAIFPGAGVVDRTQDPHLADQILQACAPGDHRPGAERAGEQLFQGLAQRVGGERIAVDLAMDAAVGIDDAHLQRVVVAHRRGHVAEAEITGQRRHVFRPRAQELPVGVADPQPRGEIAHGQRRVGWLVESDRDHLELIEAKPAAHGVHRLVQRARTGRADVEATGVDEIDQQRLAAEPRQGNRQPHAITEDVVTRELADDGLAGAQCGLLVESRPGLRLLARRGREQLARARPGSRRN